MIKRYVSFMLALTMLATMFVLGPNAVGLAETSDSYAAAEEPDLTNAIVVSNPNSGDDVSEWDPNFVFVDQWENPVKSNPTIGGCQSPSLVLDSDSAVGADESTPIAISRYQQLTLEAAGAAYHINLDASGSDPEVAGDYEVWYYNVNHIEDYRDTGNSAKQDSSVLIEVSSTPHEKTLFPDQNLNSYGTVISRRWINQQTATGDTSGWVKIGTYRFRGDQYEAVTVRKVNDGIGGGSGYDNTYTYFSKVAFVPVEKEGSTGLNLHIKRGNTSIMRETVKVTDENYTVSIPAEEVGRGANGTLEPLKVCYWTEDPAATVSVFKGNSSGGYDKWYSAQKRSWYYTLSSFTYETCQKFRFTVNASDGSSKDYYITVKVDGASENTYYGFMPNREGQNPMSTGDVVTGFVSGSGSYLSTNELTNKEYTMPHELTAAEQGRYTVNIAKFGDTIKWTPKIDHEQSANIPAGYYSAYVYATYNANKSNEYLGAVINHAGMVDQATVSIGNYNLNDKDFTEGRLWRYIGNYYFDGSDNESISISKMTDDDLWLQLSGIKLVKSAPVMNGKNFVGISLKSDGRTNGFSAESMQGDSYVLPLSADVNPDNSDSIDSLITVYTNNEAGFDELLINGEAAEPNAEIPITLNAGMNDCEISFLNASEVIESYNIRIFVPTDDNGGRAAVRVKGEALGSLNYPQSLSQLENTGDYSVQSFGANHTAYAEKMLGTGIWKVLVWRPAFSQRYNTTDTARKCYTPETVELTINGGTPRDISWKSDTSGWVDLGNIYADNSTSRIEFTGKDNAFTMIDECRFLKLADRGMIIDETALEADDIDEYIYKTDSAEASIAMFGFDGYELSINGQDITEDTAALVEVNPGVSMIPVYITKDGTSTAHALGIAKDGYSGNYAVSGYMLTKDKGYFSGNLQNGSYGAKVFVYGDGESSDVISLELALYDASGETLISSETASLTVSEAQELSTLAVNPITVNDEENSTLKITVYENGNIKESSIYINHKAMIQLFNGASASTVETQIGNYSDILGIDLTGDFAKLSNKQSVYNAMAGRSYSTAEDIANAFDAAVAIQTLNEKTDTTGAEALIKKYQSVLGVDLSEAYARLSEQTDKDKALEAVCGKGIALKAEDFAKTFEGAIYTKIFNLMDRSNCDKMVEYLAECNAKGYTSIDFTDYNSLSDSKKLEVVKKMLAVKDAKSFANLGEAAGAFNTAVTQIKNTPVKKPGSASGGGSGGNHQIELPPVSDTGNDNQTNGSQQKSEAFDDLASVPWAISMIDTLAQKGILAGVGNRIFEPDRTITREEFVKVLMAALNLPKEETENIFIDVNEGDWFYEPVMQACALGIVNGVDFDVFGTGQPITREQICTIVYRAMMRLDSEIRVDKLETNIPDRDLIPDYAVQAVESMYRAGIVSGVGDGRFEPKSYATRAQVAKIVYGVMERMKLL